MLVFQQFHKYGLGLRKPGPQAGKQAGFLIFGVPDTIGIQKTEAGGDGGEGFPRGGVEEFTRAHQGVKPLFDPPVAGHQMLNRFIQGRGFRADLNHTFRPLATSFRAASVCSTSNQSAPSSSAGCCARTLPLPQARSFTGQYRSQPQQIRSGCFGFRGIFVTGTSTAFRLVRRRAGGSDFSHTLSYATLRNMQYRALAALLLSASLLSVPSASADTKPLALTDVLAWKRIQTPSVSSDGQWFASKFAPIEGDSTVVVKNIQSGKELRFPIGELPRVDPDPSAPPPPPARDVVFSEDGKWLAFTVYPTVKEAKALKKARKPAQNKVDLVDLATGTKTEFEGIRRFEFSGQKASVLALHRYPAAAPSAPAPPASGDAKAPERPQGADLILYTLGSGQTENIGNVSEFAFDKPGNWCAWIIDAQDQLGNGISVRNLASGAVTTLDSARASYKGLSWTEKGDALATVRGVEDKAFEDKLYSVVAFRDFAAGAPGKLVYDPARDASFPKGMTVSATRTPFWLADLSEVVFGIREVKAKVKPEDAVDDRPDLIVWHWNEPRLVSMQQVQQNADKNFSFLSAWLPAENRFVRLAYPEVKQVTVNPQSRFGVGVDVREYELMGNLDGRRFSDVYSVDLKTGERKLALKKARWYQGASPDNSHLLFYEEGNFFSYAMATGEKRNLTKGLPTSFIDTEDDHNVSQPPTRSLGWSKDNDAVVVSDGWDLWKLPTDTGAAVNLTANGKKDKIRYNQIYNLDPDAKGLDFSKPLFIRAFGELTKKNGTAILEPGKPLRTPRFDDALYAGLMKAKHADVYVYSREDTQEFPDFYASGADLARPARLTDANPQQKDFAWTKGVRLIEYTGARGDKLQGDVYLPANYEPGRKYPAIFYMYEKLTQNTNAYPMPGINGFSIGYYTSNGYAVIEPDITYKVNDPGVSSTACILAALKAAIGTGVIDPARVAIHGHSWGGYQTAFAVTQTKAFRAAIAGAPLTDMVSMYSSVYWNTGSANQPIFESSQGRFTGSYLGENTEAYIRNSPVYQAQKVETPLIILSNDKDGAVDHTQGIEYFNTLRRLRKPVVMLEYKGENHGLRKPENLKDYTQRMKEFFDHYLMDKPAPKWLEEGLPLLKVNEELDARAKQLSRATASEAKPESKTPAGPGQ